MAAVGSLRFILGADSAQLETALKGAEGALRRVAIVGTTVGTLLADAIVAAFSAIKNGVTEAINAAENLGKVAQRVGMAAAELSRLQFAAQQTGVSFDTLSQGLGSLRQKMEEALLDPASEAGRTFQAMGVAIRDATGQLRPTQDVLLELATRFQGYQDGVHKGVLATNLFGNAAQEMLPFLNQGANEIRRLGDEGQRTGQTLNNEGVAAATRFNETLRQMGESSRNIWQQMAQAFLPTLQQMADMFRTASNDSSAFKIVIVALSEALKVVATTFAIINAAVETVIDVFRRLGAALSAIGRLDWEGLKAAASGAFTDIGARAEEAAARIRQIWSATQDLNAAFGKLGVGAQTLPPVVASARDLADAARAARDEARFLLDEIVKAPTETFVNKMRAIEQALRDGTITMRQFGEMTRRVQQENQRHILDLGTATATALTAIFGKNKTAAIAAAIINTAVGITRALSTLPPPFSWAQAALIAATGAAQIATIKSTNMGGGGGTPSVSGGGSAGSDQGGGPPQTLMVQGINPNQMFSGEFMRDFTEKLLQFQADGGQVILK